MWVPGIRTAVFVAEARRQAALIAELERVTDDQDFIEAVAVDWGEE